MNVNLVTCGGGKVLGNSLREIFYSKKNDAFKYPWVSALVYGNPEYIPKFISRTLQKAVSDFSKDPINSIFRATWNPLLDQFDICEIIC